jgi:PAS domain S-box-containing protein
MTAMVLLASAVAILLLPALPHAQALPADVLRLLPWLPPALVSLAAWTFVVDARRRERVLRQAQAGLEHRLHSLSDLAQAFDITAAVLRSPDGVIQHWSAGCERLFGFSSTEATGQAVHLLLSTRYPDGGRRKAQEELLRTGEWRGELRHRRRDGQQVAVAAHWILRRDPRNGDPSAVLELHADATDLKAAEAALRMSEARLRLAQEMAGVGTWEWDPEEDTLVWSAEHHALFRTGPPGEAPKSLEAFLALIHPDDRLAVRAAAYRALDSGEYEAEFRILRPGRGADEVRWLIGRGRRMPGPAGRFGPILGVHVDITARKAAEERQEMLARETDHRARNALAVVQAVLRLTRADSPDAFAKAVEGRVAALARAHTLMARSGWTGAELRTLLEAELAPFGEPGQESRTVVEGPSVTVEPTAVQPLAMAFHELATNAAKYGALSSPEGRLIVSWWIEPHGGRHRLRLRWAETGGPPIAAPPTQSGFGSRVLETTVRRQLQGTLSFHWRLEGFLCQMDIPLDRSLSVQSEGRSG